jgi:ATP-binding cassette subfamily F protein 3
MSGGEKSKVALARLAAQNANLLVLDEPTNHLDLWARDSLEQALQAFEGTLLFVSHDRYFLDRVAHKVIVLEPARWRYFEGNYSSYVQFLRNQGPVPPSPSETRTADSNPEPRKETSPRESSTTAKPKRKRQFPYRKVEDLELEIAQKEELLQALEADLADTQVQRDGERMKATLQQYQAVKPELEQLYRHWEEAIELN